jgi:hypothetical protein
MGAQMASIAVPLTKGAAEAFLYLLRGYMFRSFSIVDFNNDRNRITKHSRRLCCVSKARKAREITFEV